MVVDRGRTQAIALGGLHTCALLDDATVACFGDNQFGQLGLDDLLDRNGARMIPELTNIRALALGAYTSCAVRSDETAHCWGRNDFGQTGDGTTQHHVTPRQVPVGQPVAQVAVGSAHACADHAGDRPVLGRNAEGQIGDGTLERRCAHARSGLERRRDPRRRVSAHPRAANDQSVFCWGQKQRRSAGLRWR